MVDSKTIATMKNLFKNLMLVAVAAMAFTACSEDNNEVNNVERVTRYEFTAEVADDTRSGFVEKEDGATAYKSEWFGNETLFLVPNVGESTTAPISAEGKFSVDLSSDATQIDIYSPASSWSDYGSYCLANVPAEQTSGVNSVDPKAHIVSGYAMVDANGNQTIPVTLYHAVAYGKMTVSGVDFAIDHVVVDLKGSFSSYDRECSYTVKANGVDNTFWFATEPIDVAEFTVTAYDAEGNAVTKTVDVAALENQTLSFNCGHVSTFSVSGLEAVAEPDTVMDSAKYYYSYNNYGEYPEWGYVVFEDEYLGTLVLNCKFPNDDLVLRIGTYSAGDYTQGFDVGYSYYNVVGDSPYKLYYPSYMYVEVENGAYKLNFDIINTNGQTLKATYVGDIEGLGYPDLRTPLATPTNVTATAEGNIITIKWDPVEGADGYRVKLDSPYDEYLEEIVTTNEYVYEAQLYSKQYSFTIMSYANDENVTYKSSDDAYAYVTTGKDPNVWADVVANNIVWDSANSAFKMTGEVVSGTAWGHSSDYIRLYFNESDRPGNNSIKVGTYTGCGGTSPQADQFGARLNLYWGNVTYPSAIGSESTVQVSYDETVGYTIVLTHNNVMYGYKGTPDGWVAPSEGGDQPVDPNPGQPTPDQPEPDPSDEIWNVTTDGAINSQYTYFRFTKGSDTITGMFVYPSKSQIPGMYEVETLTSYNVYKISEVKLNGIFTDSEEGTVNIEMTPDGAYKFTLNLTLNGTKYAGTAMM